MILPYSAHGKIGVVTLLAVLLFGSAFFVSSHSGDEPEAMQLVVEHEAPFTLSLSVSMGTNGQYLQLGNAGREQVAVSIPESWERREVRYVPLDSVRSSGSSLGFTRWVLPPHALATFRSTQSWESLSLRNASETALKVDVTIADVTTGKTMREEYLVKDEELLLP